MPYRVTNYGEKYVQNSRVAIFDTKLLCLRAQVRAARIKKAKTMSKWNVVLSKGRIVLGMSEEGDPHPADTLYQRLKATTMPTVTLEVYEGETSPEVGHPLPTIPEVREATFQDHYAAFVAMVCKGFDENGSEAELLASAARFIQAHKCFVLGELIADEELQAACQQFKVLARAENEILLPDVERSLNLLTEFCQSKASGTAYRLRGKIVVAMRCESAAERRYKQLPPEFRW